MYVCFCFVIGFESLPKPTYHMIAINVIPNVQQTRPPIVLAIFHFWYNRQLPDGTGTGVNVDGGVVKYDKCEKWRQSETTVKIIGTRKKIDDRKDRTM